MLTVYKSLYNKYKFALRKERLIIQELNLKLFDYLWNLSLSNISVDIADVKVIPRIKLSSISNSFKHTKLYFAIYYDNSNNKINLNVKAIHFILNSHIKSFRIKDIENIKEECSKIIGLYLSKYFCIEDNKRIEQLSFL